MKKKTKPGRGNVSYKTFVKNTISQTEELKAQYNNLKKLWEQMGGIPETIETARLIESIKGLERLIFIISDAYLIENGVKKGFANRKEFEAWLDACLRNPNNRISRFSSSLEGVQGKDKKNPAGRAGRGDMKL
jgi:hypothetical protein